MKVLHLNAGNETGGGMHHILSLLNELSREEFVLGVLEKGELYKRALDAGIHTVHFPHRTRLSIPLIQRMKRFIRKEHIDVLHTHGPRANVYANILKKLLAFQWITTIHSDPYYDFRHKGMYGRFMTAIHVRAIRKADRIIAISEAFRTNLAKAGVEKKRMVTALNGIDFREEIPDNYKKSAYGFAPDDFIFLMVARLEPVKGHHCAIRAFAEIAKRRSRCHLLLVGDGSLKRELQRLTSQLSLDNHVHFYGHREPADPFYKLADVTLLTSFSESFPLVLLESARAKTPVIASNVGGVKHLIADPSLGWCTWPGNINELRKAMGEAVRLREKDELRQMGDKLNKYAAAEFSLEIFAENVYNVYLSVEK